MYRSQAGNDIGEGGDIVETAQCDVIGYHHTRRPCRGEGSHCHDVGSGKDQLWAGSRGQDMVHCVDAALPTEGSLDDLAYRSASLSDDVGETFGTQV